MKLKLFAAIATLTVGLTHSAIADENYTVSVSQIVEHPALNATRDGLLQGLKEAGYVEGKNLTFIFKTAQGNPATAVQIARDFVGNAPDVLVGIATPSAQALVSATTDIPIVFSAVTDPVGAALLTDMDAPNANVTGLSDRSPVGQHIDLMLRIKPETKIIGVVFNPGESNSQAIIEDLKAAAADRGLEVIESPAVQSADVLTASRNLIGKVDFIYAPTDNTVATTIEIIVEAGKKGGIPVFAGSNSFVEKGALIGLGFDYKQIGLQTATYVVAILEGKSISELPAKVATGSDIVINAVTAKALSITIPEDVMKRAQKVFE